MKKYIGAFIVSGLILCALNSCSFVNLNPDAAQVNIANNKQDINGCKFVGNTTVSIWAKSNNFQSQKTVEDQLNTLARNQAAKMGGNTVVAASIIENSQRTYGVYRCDM